LAYEKREGSGALFKNDRKEQDSHPDYKGDILINGQEFWLSAWIKTAGSGTKFMSISAQPKQKGPPPMTTPQTSIEDDLKDEIPF